MTQLIKVLTAVMVSVFLTAGPDMVFADDALSYEQLSPNGKYVFVMLTKGPAKLGRVDTLKSKYECSGLYKANNSLKPLWRVNWYSPTVHVSSDGAHLVRVGRAKVEAMNGKPDMAQLALAFYKNGKLLKRYLIGNVISAPSKLVKWGTGFRWQKRIAFDDESGKLSVTLVTGQTKVFNIKSGLIIPDKSAANKRR
ncbi:MAG: hypothetical protein WCY36_07685 [Candidatus Omnitrophota bacterium]